MDTRPRTEISTGKLWFGFAAAAIAWVVLGCTDLVITWRACMLQRDYGVPDGVHTGVRILYIAVALGLLITAVSAGIISYRNWKILSSQRNLLNAQAVERHEFLAYLGVLIRVFLGMGIIWLSLPPFLIELCWRAK